MTTPTETTIADRYLLTPATASFPERAILVSSGGTGPGEESEVRLALTAPGLGRLNIIRSSLGAWLRQSLPTIHPSWVFGVSIEPHFQSGEPEIVVAINDPQFLSFESHDLVLDAARVLLTPVAKENYRQIVTLQGGQRLVPLHFEVDDFRPTMMELKLPGALEFIRPPRFAIFDIEHKPNEQPEHSILGFALQVALARFEIVQDVWVRSPSDGGASVTIIFSSRAASPSAGALNALQTAVTQVISNHARYKGFYDLLVFTPADHQHAEEDGVYDEDAGFLNEYREY